MPQKVRSVQPSVFRSELRSGEAFSTVIGRVKDPRNVKPLTRLAVFMNLCNPIGNEGVKSSCLIVDVLERGHRITPVENFLNCEIKLFEESGTQTHSHDSSL